MNSLGTLLFTVPISYYFSMKAIFDLACKRLDSKPIYCPNLQFRKPFTKRVISCSGAGLVATHTA